MRDSLLKLLAIMFLPAAVGVLIRIIAIVIDEISYDISRKFIEKRECCEVVRCKDCVLHNNCTTEDVFNFVGKTDGFCCVGKKVE